MKAIHTVALAAASAAFLGLGGQLATAQSVSGSDPYVQGYAAGASAKEHNNFNTFDSGYRAGKAAQTAADSQAADVQAYNSAQAYDRGFQAGIARTNRDREQAYNEGYEDRLAARAFDNGFDAGAYQRARDEADYP